MRCEDISDHDKSRYEDDLFGILQSTLSPEMH